MVPAAYLTLATMMSVRFPAQPIEREFRRGVAMARRTSSVETMLAEDHWRTGYRFNGQRRQASEWVALLSPDAVSRWLGFVAEREALDRDEIARRWGELREALDEKITFAVRLSAFPRDPAFDLIEAKPGDPRVLAESRFVVGWNEARRTAREAGAVVYRSRDPDEIARYAWWRGMSALGGLGGERDRTDRPYYELGDYHARWVLIQTPAWSEETAAGRITIRILSSRRERIHDFWLLSSPPPRSPRAR